MMFIILILLLNSLCNSEIQLPSNTSVPFIYETEVNEVKSEIPHYTDEDSYMEEEDRIYPRRWRLVDDGEEEKYVYDSLEDEGFIVYEVDGTRRPTEKIFGHFSKYKNSYLILAPVVARPNSVYRLVVLLYKVDDPSKAITVKASMSSTAGNELTFAETSTVKGESTELMMKLPGSLPGPKLKLRVEAQQGTNVLFVNTTLVHPSTEFLTIAIFMARACFCQDQQVEFRVILLTHDMLPYQDPVDVFILDATGYIVKRWISRIPNIGVINLDFFTPSIPLAGFWRVRVQAKSQVKEHPFLVIAYYIPRFEVMYDFPAFILSSEETISGEIDAYVTNDAPVIGNMTVTLWAKYPATAHDSHYKEITSQVFDYVEELDNFEFEMSLLEGQVPKLVGTEVKVTTAFMDRYTGMTVYGYAKSRIIAGEVVVKFIGPSPVIFRPGMPLTLNVNVAYDDLEQIDPEDLLSSSLKITSTVVLKTGGTVTLPQIYIPPESEDGQLTEIFFSETDENILRGTLSGKDSFKKSAYGNTYYTLNNTDSFDENEDLLLHARYRAILAKETYIKKQQFGNFRETGIFTFTLEIPKDATSLTVNAVYTDGEGTTAGEKLEGIPNYHPNERHLHVTSTTEKGIIGEYAVFHVRTNFPLQKFHYVVLSKGILVHSSTEDVPFAGAEGVATLALAISREMFPLMTFLAYHVDLNGDINADFIKIPVETPSAFTAELILNEHKDHTKRTVEGIVMGETGTLYYLSCARQTSYNMQPTNRLTKGSFIEEALSQEPMPRTVSKVTIQPRNRADPYSVQLLTSGDTEGDVRQTFQSTGLSPLSDKRFYSSSPSLGNCEVSLGLLECGDGTCYQFRDICNGVNNCKDGSDERECNYQYIPTRTNEEGIDEIKIYHLLRQSWWKDLFDTEDGSFAWATQFIDHGGNEQIGLEIPRTQDDWVIEGVAVHQEFGIAFLEPQLFTSNPPVFLGLEGPTICRRGEQVSIRTAIFNSMPFEQYVLLAIPESEDYKFVYVEEKGLVDFFRPRLSTGEHQHFLPVGPEAIVEVFLPFAIKKQAGTIEIVIKMRTQVAWDEESWEIEVKPEGAPVIKHTSVLLDLKSRALFYEFLDIPIDESPIIQNSLLRRFVAGSPQASISISGDVFGPTSEDISVHYDNAFKGQRSLKSTDGLAFNFGATLWTLHYMRLTNQLTISEATAAFDFLNVQMAGILTRMINGGFKMWHYSGPSVWLTAWVTNLFQNAMFEEWEYLIYVDPRVLTDAVKFMLKYQNPDGDFGETEFYNVTLDHKYRYQKRSFPNEVSIGLTALVTATIKEVVDSLHGTIRKRANQAILRAQRFLEKSLSSLEDPYDIAITAWALNMIGSTEKDVAVSKLLQIVRPQEGFLYWSKDVIKSNSRIFENNQRNFLQPKEPQEWDASSIEATSYALLVLLSQEGVTVREERIVNWLVSVRDWDFAFDATVDSIIAFRALTEYCYRARLRDVTELKVDIETSADQTFSEQINIEQPFVSALKALEIPNPWGHVLLTGRGAGQALAQLTTTWGVDVPEWLESPPRQYFTLYVSEYHHQARNKSRITTTVCTKWIATDFNPTSHAAMIEVEVPTGYFLHLPEANQVARKAIEDGNFPEMKDVFCTEAYIFFQFSHIPSYQQCFKYDLHRWHPVANLTRTRSAMVFELFAPERFEQIILNTTTLSALDVCEVCGSYQCPYCPFYSSSNVFRTSFILMVLSFIVAQNFVYSYDTVLLPLSLIYDMFNRRIS